MAQAIDNPPILTSQKVSDMGTSSTSVSITLLTEVAPIINGQNQKLNEIRTALRNAGLMA